MAALTQAYLAQDCAGGTFPTVITMAVLAFCAIMLRVASRVYARAKFWWDDWTIFIAFSFEISLSFGILYAAKYLGAGRHIQVLTQWQRTTLDKNLIAFQQVYFITQTTIKISVLLLYYRIFGIHTRFRIAAYVAGGIVIGWEVACFFATMFTCVPLQAMWTPSIKHSKCIHMRSFGIANGTFNMLTDIMVLALSVPMVWSLQLSLRKKILLSGAFLVGAFVCAISIVRLSAFSGFDMSDPSYGLARISIWTSIESCCSVIAACLPTLGPLIIGALRLKSSQADSDDPGSLDGRANKRTIPSHQRSIQDEETHPRVASPMAARLRDSFTMRGRFYRVNYEDTVALRDIFGEDRSEAGSSYKLDSHSHAHH